MRTTTAALLLLATATLYAQTPPPQRGVFVDDIAWLAFQEAQKTRPAATIDGFTPAQQFFIAWGQFRGDETRPETQRLMVQGDPHPVARYRVIGPISNLPDFARTFDCPAESAMVRPEGKRCEVW